MNLLYVIRYWPTLTETFVVREIQELQRRGHRVTVFALGTRADGKLTPEVSSIAVIYPPKLPWQSWMHRTSAALLKIALRQGFLSQLAQGFDRIHVHFAGEALEWAVAAAGRIPVTVTVHAVDLFKPRPSLRENLRRVESVITVCAHHQQWLKEHYHVSSRVIRCGVPLEVPLATGNGDRLRVISIARHVPKKGLDLVLALAEKMPEADFRLISDHPGSSRVPSGSLPAAAIPAALASADLFLLPCRVAEDGDRDGIPVALMEAMAAGLPVVTTSVAGIPELVNEEVGWCIPSNDLPALEAAVRAALDADERKRRGQAARKRIEAWGNVERQVDELLAVWS